MKIEMTTAFTDHVSVYYMDYEEVKDCNIEITWYLDIQRKDNHLKVDVYATEINGFLVVEENGINKMVNLTRE